MEGDKKNSFITEVPEEKPEDKSEDKTEEKPEEQTEDKPEKKVRAHLCTPAEDPRFQQQNQTLRCFVMYTDFYRCENILGEGSEACTWFKKVFTSICPIEWVHRWDELRLDGNLPWQKYKTQGKFPGYKYGD